MTSLSDLWGVSPNHKRVYIKPFEYSRTIRLLLVESWLCPVLLLCSSIMPNPVINQVEIVAAGHTCNKTCWTFVGHHDRSCGGV